MVPLGVPISRFERRPVPVQTWTITAGDPRYHRESSPISSIRCPNGSCPGEFFDLTEDQQLTEPAFVSHAGGVRVGTDGVLLGAGHRVDDGYETVYEPPLPTREFSAFGRGSSAARRCTRSPRPSGWSAGAHPR